MASNAPLTAILTLRWILILRDRLRGEDRIAELSRREGISLGIYYRWSKHIMEAGGRRLADYTTRAATID